MSLEKKVHDLDGKKATCPPALFCFIYIFFYCHMNINNYSRQMSSQALFAFQFNINIGRLEKSLKSPSQLPNKFFSIIKKKPYDYICILL